MVKVEGAGIGVAPASAKENVDSAIIGAAWVPAAAQRAWTRHDLRIICTQGALLRA